jgi:tryptophan halogenase
MIIGKKYETEWVSYKNHLTLDSAFSFQLPIDSEKIKPATIATAMNSGWMWKIPLTYRFGCGYIYDSNFITEEEAIKEVELHLDTQIEIVNRFKFNAGRYENSWVKNCCAIGLSSNFTEPLEATSIWLQFLSLAKLMECNFFDLCKDKNIVDDYNNYVANLSDLTMNFLYFHYMTKRDDTPFWKTYSKRTTIPKQLKSLIDFWNQKAHTPHDEDMLGDVFGVASYLMVGHGNKFWNKKSSKNYCDVRNLDNVEKFVSNIPKIENFLLEKSITHEDFLRYL